MKLEGRVAIVTGAAQGIGRAIAEKLQGGGRADRRRRPQRRRRAQAAAQALDGLAIQADISSEADADRIAAETLERYGRIDVLVNAAAIVPFIPWDEVDFAYWRQDHLRQPRRRLPRLARGRGADARGRLRAHRPHRLQRVLRRHPEHGPLPGRQGRRRRPDAGARDRARQVRHHRERGRARHHPHRGRARDAAQGRLRLRADAAGDPAPRAAGRHRAGRRRSWPPRSRAGSPARCSSSTPATSATDGARRHPRRERSSPSPTSSARSRSTATGSASTVEARYDDPPYATLVARRGAALAGRAGPPGRGPPRRRDGRRRPTARRLAAILVLEVADCLAAHRELRAAGVPLPRRALLAAVGWAPLLRRRPRRQPRRTGGAGMRAVATGRTSSGSRSRTVADPVLEHDTDAIVRVTHTAICGADLLPYHGYTPGLRARHDPRPRVRRRRRGRGRRARRAARPGCASSTRA